MMNPDRQNVAQADPAVRRIYELLKAVKDPEVPVIDVVELGVVRRVSVADDGAVNVDITPTYSGCPAMKVMETQIVARLKAMGVPVVNIKTVLFPPWTTDWMEEAARAKLKAYGIAPPGDVSDSDLDPLHRAVKSVDCPFCDSTDTTLTSQFGSTACKALYTCNACRQPFEHFKCI